MLSVISNWQLLTKKKLGCDLHLPNISPALNFNAISQVQQTWRGMLHREYKDSLLEAYCKQVKKCVEIGLKCVEKDRKKRPEIQDTIDQLTETEKCISMLDTVRRGKVIVRIHLHLFHNDVEILSAVMILDLLNSKIFIRFN